MSLVKWIGWKQIVACVPCACVSTGSGGEGFLASLSLRPPPRCVYVLGGSQLCFPFASSPVDLLGLRDVMLEWGPVLSPFLVQCVFLVGEGVASRAVALCLCFSLGLDS